MFKTLLRLTKHTVIYGIGHVLSRSMGLILIPIHTNFILPEKMGVAAIIFLFLGFMTVVFQFGYAEAFLRYFALTKDLSERRTIFSNAYISVALLSLFFSVIIYIYAKDISIFIFNTSIYQHLIVLCIGILIGDVLSQIPLLLLRIEEKSLTYILILTLNIIINISMNLLFIVFLNKGITGIFISNLISSLFTLLLVIPIILKYLKFSISVDNFRELTLFGLPYMATGIFKIIMDLADRFILERLTDLTTVGIYNAGYKLGTMMGLVVAGFRFAWIPFFLSISDEKDAKEIYAKVLTYFIFVCGMIFLFITFFIKNLMELKIAGLPLLGTKYLDGIIIVPWILIAYILYGIYSNFLVGVYIEKKSQVASIIMGIGAAINIVGNYLLIPYYGMIGAAIVTVISYLFMMFFLYFTIQKYYYIRYEFGQIIKLILVFTIIYFIGIFNKGSNVLIIRLALVLIIPAILYIIGFIKPQEIKKLKQVFIARYQIKQAEE